VLDFLVPKCLNITTMKLSEDLQARNLIKQTTFKDIGWIDQPKTFYLGADAGSADSLTVGNLAIFLVAKRLVKSGWKAVLLMGGATSMIGDPGGKDSERELVSKQIIDNNILGIKSQVEKLFDGQSFELVNNYEWFSGLGYLDFLRDIGKHYSMTELVQRDYIKDRIGEGGVGISYAEFSYSLIQGYDYYWLNTNKNVVLQIGGSDQWGNMLSGVPLIRKKSGAEVHAMSMPLVINKITGKKFGKSEDGAVWLDSKKTSAYDFYQFWLNSDDEGVEDYLKIYTELDIESIAHIMTEFSLNKGLRLAQKTLASEVTKIVHGDTQMQAVANLSDCLSKEFAYDSMSAEYLLTLMESSLCKHNLTQESSFVEVVADCFDISKSEARRHILAGAVKLNDQKAIEVNHVVDKSKFALGFGLIKLGKNKYAVVL
jgi:tyrosyl-tRNA synthetase